MAQPIDYARAESEDVVRKKFRRRVVWFVVATVVVMGIGVGWQFFLRRGTTWFVGNEMPTSTISIASYEGWIIWYGPPRKTGATRSWKAIYESSVIGFQFHQFDDLAYPKWQVGVRYRTLFILAMIPWLITLLRMIRTRRRIHRLEPA